MTDSTDSTATSEGGALLTNAYGDQYLYSVNRQVFSTKSADSVYKSYLPSFFWDKNSLFIVVGTDSGLLTKHIAKHGVPHGSHYLFVELDEIIDQVSQQLKSTKIEQGIILTNLAQWTSKAEALGYKNYLYMNRVYVIQSLGSIRAFIPAYQELLRLVMSETTSWEWFLRQQYASKQFLSCQLANLAENQTPMSILKDSFLGKTAVLLASGPSLDDYLPWIQANRDKFLVAAISRTARRLIEAGLKPDMVFTIDPNMVSFDVSKEMLDFDPSVLLVNTYQAMPHLVAQWRGPKVYMGSRLPWKNEDDNPYDGITVTNAAIEALADMGCSQIVLIGVDLCFRADGSLYSSGTSESDVGPVLGHIGPKVETNDGQMAETCDGYTEAITNLTEQAARLGDRDCRLINPAPSAAKIPNVEHCLIDTIPVGTLDEPAIDTLSQYLPANDREHRLDHYHSVEQEIVAALSGIERVSEIISKILHGIDRLFGRKGMKPNLKYKNQIIELEDRLAEEFHDEFILVKKIAIGEFLRFLGRSKLGNRNLAELEHDGRVYYQACHDGAQQLIQICNEALQRIHSRIAEEQSEPDFTALSKQWQRDDTPGRALVWQHYHPEAYAALTPDEQALFASNAAQFREKISNRDTVHMQYCQWRASLENVPAKTKLLFSQQDIAGLKNLVEGLSKLQDGNAQHHLDFAAGCLAELEDREDDALEQYRHISEGPLLEDALLHVSHLCIKRGDAPNALLALECLAHMSISYVPTYAEIVWHTGHIKEAAELFTQYLQQVPTDLGTYLRLGKLYQKQGIFEAARMAYCHVLEQDPGNQTAKSRLNTMDETTASLQHNCV